MPSHSQFLGCVDPRAVEKTLMGVFTQPGPTPAYCIAQSERQLLYVMGIISQIADLALLRCTRQDMTPSGHLTIKSAAKLFASAAFACDALKLRARD